MAEDPSKVFSPEFLEKLRRASVLPPGVQEALRKVAWTPEQLEKLRQRLPSREDIAALRERLRPEQQRPNTPPEAPQLAPLAGKPNRRVHAELKRSPAALRQYEVLLELFPPDGVHPHGVLWKVVLGSLEKEFAKRGWKKPSRTIFGLVLKALKKRKKRGRSPAGVPPESRARQPRDSFGTPPWLFGTPNISTNRLPRLQSSGLPSALFVARAWRGGASTK
jgi:hypothetical protein